MMDLCYCWVKLISDEAGGKHKYSAAETQETTLYNSTIARKFFKIACRRSEIETVGRRLGAMLGILEWLKGSRNIDMKQFVKNHTKLSSETC